jgi:hypothetical protein
MEMEEFVEEEKEKEKEVEESLVLVDQLKEDLEEVEWEGGDESLVVEQLVEKVEEVEEEEEEEEEIIEQQWWWTVAGVALLPWCSWFNCWTAERWRSWEKWKRRRQIRMGGGGSDIWDGTALVWGLSVPWCSRGFTLFKWLSL